MNKIYSIVAAIMVAQCSMAALTVTWGSTDLASLPDSPDAAWAQGWLVQLYVAADSVAPLSQIVGFDPLDGFLPVYDPSGPGPDMIPAGAVFQQTIQIGKGGTDFGAAMIDWDVAGVRGESVYTVVFNNASIGDATWAIILDAAPFQLPESGEGINYTLNAETAQSWVPVPEPGTIMLGLAGLAILGNKLRKRSKNA